MADLLVTRCPECQAKLRVGNTSDAARRIRCPRCKAIFAPEPAAAPAAAPHKVAPPAAPRRRIVQEAPADEPEPDDPPVVKKRRAVVAPEDAPEPEPEPQDEAPSEEEDRPRKKKKKKKKAETDDPYRKWIFIAAGTSGVMFLGLVIFVFVKVFGWSSGNKLIVPGEYTYYESSEAEFRLDYPKGWKFHAGGIRNHRFAKCTSADAEIYVREGIEGSVKADIAAGFGGAPNLPETHQPFARVHEERKDFWAEEIGGGYQEQGAAKTVKTGFGSARLSVFTTGGGFSKKMRGYRVTVLAHLVQYDIICKCPEGDWAKLQPVFDKVIASFAIGRGEK